ncbi:hypothetical protein MXB_3193, partial [Myxobolus squamalis]
MGFTSKKAWKYLRTKMEALNINQSKNFAIRYRKKDRENLLYSDEKWFYIYTSKSYRYTPVNTPAKLFCQQLVGIIFCIWHSFLHEVFYTVMWFLELEFLNELPTRNVFNINTIVLMDNVGSTKLKLENSFNFDFLRPNSYKLNPLKESKYNNKRPRPNNLNILKQYVAEMITEIFTDVDF